MDLEQALERVAVIGAGGKMGRGIALLMIRHARKLICIDPEIEDLKEYLATHLEKDRERNSALPDDYVEKLLSRVYYSECIAAAKDCHLVMEAAVESLEAKQQIFKQLPNSYILTNTSSLPIGILDESCELRGRILGFHFYNPPPVQKLVELITTEQTRPELVQLANDLGERLGKTLVCSNDIAGFIGNGHFMRDLLFACDQESIAETNTVTQELLIRPMGIFQLADYVGIDVCQKILAVMDSYIEDEALHSDLIDKMLEQGVRGGQFPDGSQRDGFLQYEKGQVTGVYSLDTGEYEPLPQMELPEYRKPWKSLLKADDRQAQLDEYFQKLGQDSGPAVQLAQRYLARSRDIALQLVKDGVAQDVADVNAVLCLGFYHLYGPVSECLAKA